MSRLRSITALLACLALASAVACLWRVSLGKLDWANVALIPLSVSIFIVWFHALKIATRVAQRSTFASIPGMAQFWGLYHATIKAPLLVIGISVLGVVILLFFGRAGEVNGWPSTPADAQISLSVLISFLILSLPTLFTRHSDAP